MSVSINNIPVPNTPEIPTIRYVKYGLLAFTLLLFIGGGLYIIYLRHKLYNHFIKESTVLNKIKNANLGPFPTPPPKKK